MSLFSRRLRGFRIVDLIFLTVLLVIALVSYSLKTLASAQGADTVGVETKIGEEQKRIRLLKAEISHLEDPGRIERLATDYLHMGPVDAAHDATLADLPRIARASTPPSPEVGRGDSPKASAVGGQRPARDPT